MTTTEKNKLIAEFMGYIDNGCSEEGFLIHPDTNYDIEIETLQYHSSWDWLMPVVEKIESLGYRVTIVKHICRIDLNEESKLLISEDIKKIEAVYTVCFKFIQWYNQNKLD